MVGTALTRLCPSYRCLPIVVSAKTGRTCLLIVVLAKARTHTHQLPFDEDS